MKSEELSVDLRDTMVSSRTSTLRPQRRYQRRGFRTTLRRSSQERHCTLLGGNLASIQSEAEYDFIRGVVLKAAGRHQESWVGGYDAAKEGVWLWSDGSQFEFKRWGKGEPNNRWFGEGCMEINLKGRDFVNDAKCSQEQPFICAKDL
ncbi:galactose-specific lectin nattectin-like [Halichoeres trimaculatus]|uniref:galactose-specific lectin nattectin-like n=1 Tax=Halichoeres trimaculatus TaxID=147232 RepID=UPI003D9DCB9E